MAARTPPDRPARSVSYLAPRPPMDLNGKTLLITGATGSFGRAFMRTVLERYDVEAIRVFSRDELKQSELERTLPRRPPAAPARRRARPRPPALATRGVDVIVHAAALKQVPACEYNPFEAVQTNVLGAENVISAAIDNHVPLTIALSTDKAVNPANLYGATKLCAEKIVAQAGVYAGGTPARFASVRYGNVVGSRGSVIPIFKQQAQTGLVTHHRRADDPLLDHAAGGGRVRAQLAPARARRRDLRAQDPEHADRRRGRARSRRASSGGSSASGPARSCTRCCSRRTRRATPSTSATAT